MTAYHAHTTGKSLGKFTLESCTCAIQTVTLFTFFYGINNENHECNSPHFMSKEYLGKLLIRHVGIRTILSLSNCFILYIFHPNIGTYYQKRHFIITLSNAFSIVFPLIFCNRRRGGKIPNRTLLTEKWENLLNI